VLPFSAETWTNLEGVGPIGRPSQALELRPRGFIGRRRDGHRAAQALAALCFDAAVGDAVQASGDLGRGQGTNGSSGRRAIRGRRLCGWVLASGPLPPAASRRRW
jgi:hypothetical protein